jgi:hypothetical protein
MTDDGIKVEPGFRESARLDLGMPVPAYASRLDISSPQGRAEIKKAHHRCQNTLWRQTILSSARHVGDWSTRRRSSVAVCCYGMGRIHNDSWSRNGNSGRHRLAFGG